MFLSHNDRLDAEPDPGVPTEFTEGLARLARRHGLDEETVRRHLELDRAPIPPDALRQNYHKGRHLAYWMSGLADYRRVMMRHRALGGGEPGVCFDMGGSSGRVARHFAAAHPGARVHVSDLVISPVEWALTHLPANVSAWQGTVIPHVPLPDRSVDIVTAFSVFTHIDGYEYAWLAELARIAAPGALIWITVHTEENWDAHMAIDWRYATISRNARGFGAFERGAPMPADRDRIAFATGEGYFVVFHRRRHIERVWSRFFEIEDIVLAPDLATHSGQTTIVMRPRG